MKPRFLPYLLLLLCLSLFLSLTGASTVESAGDWRFGVIESYEDPAAATNLGASWTRVRFQWAEVQAGGPDTWTPRVSEAQINGEIAAGRLVVGMLIGVPDWARDGNRLPQGLWLPHTDPGNTWAEFVRQAVTRYRGRIDHWIIWNEPDVWDVAAPGHTWDGTEEDFFQLQRVAYLIAKENNPNSVIHLAAMTYFWDAQFGREQYLDRLLRVIVADPDAEANSYYFDVLTAHLYFQPNLVFDIIQAFHGLRAAAGIPWKPLWLVETNAPPIDDPAWPVDNWTLSVSLEEQAAYMPQAIAVALTAGAERIAVYKLKDTEDDVFANPEPFGLLRMDGSQRPAYTTYQVAIQYLSGMTAALRERWDAVGQVRITQGDQTTTVLFSRLPAAQRAQVPATAEKAILADMRGARRVIDARDGVFTVDLPGAPCTQSIGDYCMIGGQTYYLVQSTSGDSPPPPPADPGQPTPTMDPILILDTATPTASATRPPSATPSATATATATGTATPSPTPTATATQTNTPLPTATETATPTTPAPTVTPSPTLFANLGEAQTRITLGYWLLGTGAVLALASLGMWLSGRRSRAKA